MYSHLSWLIWYDMFSCLFLKDARYITDLICLDIDPSSSGERTVCGKQLTDRQLDIDKWLW